MGEGFDPCGIAFESQVEELGRGFVEGECVYVVKGEGCGGFRVGFYGGGFGP